MTVRREMLGGAAARGVMVNGCPLARERNINVTAPTVSFDGSQAMQENVLRIVKANPQAIKAALR